MTRFARDRIDRVEIYRDSLNLSSPLLLLLWWADSLLVIIINIISNEWEIKFLLSSLFFNYYYYLLVHLFFVFPLFPIISSSRERKERRRRFMISNKFRALKNRYLIWIKKYPFQSTGLKVTINKHDKQILFLFLSFIYCCCSKC